jgi:hypothetical protein
VGRPEAHSHTALLKPPEAVVARVIRREWPWATDMDGGEAERVKLSGGRS